MEAIKIRIRDSLVKVLEIGSCTVTDLEDLSQLGLDSIRTISLVVELEEVFNIVFGDDELLFENFATLQKIADRVEGKLVALP